MPVKIIRASTAKPLPPASREPRTRGFEFVAVTHGGRYRFRVIDVEQRLAVDVNSGKTWWIEPDWSSVRLPSTSVRAVIEE